MLKKRIKNASGCLCSILVLDNIVKEPTCFKNPNNPSCIDLILTYFQNTTVVETLHF